MRGETALQAPEVRARRVPEMIEEPRRTRDHLLHRGILAVEDAQGIGVQPSSRILVEQSCVLLEVRDESGAVGAALLGVADRIDLEAHGVAQPEAGRRDAPASR